MTGETEKPKLNWRHPDFLKTSTECDVCKQGWSDRHPLRWWGRTSSVICSRKQCVEVMQGWWEETCRSVDERLSREREEAEEETE
jgi:hypothetical protein